MQQKKVLILSAMIIVVLLFQQCSKKDDTTTTTTDTVISPTLPATVFNYIDTYPAFVQAALTATDNTPTDNNITNDGATLGRVLFYDKHLSKNNTVSCGSCHKPENSFTDNATLSKGFDGGLTTRHSMALLNVRFYKSGKMFWDERAPTLEKQILQPIQNTVEMGLTLAELETKVKALSYYPALFQKAFGSTQIDSVKIAKAVAQFVRSIVTFKSKYDQVKQGLTTFTADEAAGEQLFLTPPPLAGAPSCGGCHTPPMFIASDPVAPFAFPDPADAGINGQNRFKAGSLRNIAITGPYFHNGKVANLMAMLAPGPGLGIPAHTVMPADAAKIVAFLQTLTDNSVTTDARFADPFK